MYYVNTNMFAYYTGFENWDHGLLKMSIHSKYKYIFDKNALGLGYETELLKY